MWSGALLAALTLLAPIRRDSIFGSVRDAVSGAPLAGVRVVAGGGPATISSVAGEYSIAISSVGTHWLTFRRLGYDPLVLSVTLRPGTSLQIDAELEPQPLPLPPLVVAGNADTSAGRAESLSRDSSEIGFRHLATNALARDPLVLGDDPLVAAAAAPDASGQAGFPTSLHVHGGASDQNLILVDGLPVYGAMHIAGAASLFNPDAVEGVDLHSAVPPASYGGRLSSTVNLHLSPPTAEHLRFRGGWDQSTVRQLVEGSLAGGAGSFLLSGRRSYRSVFAQPGDGSWGNSFHDLLARVTLALPGDHLALYFLHGGDGLDFPSTADGSLPNNLRPSEDRGNQFDWSSQTAGAVWTRSRSAGATLSTRLWSASSRAAIDWAADTNLTQVRSELREIGFSSELTMVKRSSRRRIGFSLQRTDVDYVVTTAAPLRLHSAPVLLGAFVEERRSLGKRWIASAGIRANSVNGASLMLEPRLWVRYRLSPRVSLSFGAARLHQYVQSMRNEESLLDRAFGADLPVTVGAGGLRPALSEQLFGELQARPSPAVTLTLSGYSRHFAGLLIPPAAGAAPFASAVPQAGSGHAEGMELDGRYQGPVLEVRANLGTAGTQRSVGLMEFSPTALRSAWLEFGMVRPIGGLASIRLTNTLATGAPASVLRGDLDWQPPSGWPASGELSGSPEETLGPLNAMRLPLYARTDLGLMRQWPVDFPGRTGVLTTSLTVTNLFNRRNVLGYFTAADLNSRRALLFPLRSFALQLGWRF